MTHRSTGSRTLRVEALARVEGEGAMHVEIRDGRVDDVRLKIYEPPRFFEAFLRGRSYTEPPDITARICGICPVAYQMSACQAIEAACGVAVEGPLDDLRRLLYCGEWIESHTLHVHLLHAPDFLGYPDGIAMAEDHPAEVQRGLALKKAGNDLVDLVGGRPIHPVNVRVGGFYRVPTRRELGAFRPRLEKALYQAIDVVRWVSGFEFEGREEDWELAALQRPGEYAITGGRLRSTSGLDIGPDEFLDHVTETQVEHSTALHAGILGRGSYLVGPLARYALSSEHMAPPARQAAAEAGLDTTTRDQSRSIVVRAVETVHACAEALRIIDSYVEPDAPAVTVEPRAGVGTGWTEAPRGVLWHRYELDEEGIIVDATIVPPTAQNQPTIEHDLFHFVERHLDLDDEQLRHRAEQVIRAYDPCISCATHFLDLTVDRS